MAVRGLIAALSHCRIVFGAAKVVGKQVAALRNLLGVLGAGSGAGKYASLLGDDLEEWLSDLIDAVEGKDVTEQPLFLGSEVEALLVPRREEVKSSGLCEADAFRTRISSHMSAIIFMNSRGTFTVPSSSSWGLEHLAGSDLRGDNDLKDISDMLSSQPWSSFASGSKSRSRLENCLRSSWLLSNAASVSSLLVGDMHPASGTNFSVVRTSSPPQPRRCAVDLSSRPRAEGAHLLVAFAFAKGLSARKKGTVGLRQPLAMPSDANSRLARPRDDDLSTVQPHRRTLQR